MHSLFSADRPGDCGRSSTLVRVPSFGLATLPGVLVRPLCVTIAHLPVLLVALCARPIWAIWAIAAAPPATHGEPRIMRLAVALLL